MAHPRASAWMIWLGAFLVLSLIPLKPLYVQLSLAHGWDAPAGKLVVVQTPVSAYEWVRPVTLPMTAFQIGVLLPSLLATLTPRRFARAVLVAFLPLSAFFCAWASNAAASFPFSAKDVVILPAFLAGAVPAAAAVAVVLAYVVGVPSPILAPWARRLLAVDILWIVLLQWNALGMSPRYFPGWIGAAGASMILSGEILAPRDSRFRIRDSPRAS